MLTDSCPSDTKAKMTVTIESERCARVGRGDEPLLSPLQPSNTGAFLCSRMHLNPCSPTKGLDTQHVSSPIRKRNSMAGSNPNATGIGILSLQKNLEHTTEFITPLSVVGSTNLSAVRGVAKQINLEKFTDTITIMRNHWMLSGFVRSAILMRTSSRPSSGDFAFVQSAATARSARMLLSCMKTGLLFPGCGVSYAASLHIQKQKPAAVANRGRHFLQCTPKSSAASTNRASLKTRP